MLNLDEIYNQLLLYSKKLEAIYLYGSVARGDQDELSDLDLLIISETSPTYFIGRLKEDLGLAIENEIEIVSRKQLTDMFSSGSDLAWTIYQDAKLLFSQPQHIKLPIPNKHTLTHDFISSQYQKIKFAADSVTSNSELIGFECIQIYSAIRRIHIALNLQFSLYSSSNSLRALNSFAPLKNPYQMLRAFVRQGKAGLRKPLLPAEYILNFIDLSVDWLVLVAHEYELDKESLNKLAPYNERAFNARKRYREVLDFYSKEFNRLPPPFTLSNAAIDAWCKDAYNAGYDRRIELYRFSTGDFTYRLSDTLSRLYATLYQYGIPVEFSRYINLVLKNN